MEPEPSFDMAAPRPSTGSLMSLINTVQGIDIRELGLRDDRGGRGNIDWPQICVVGGQSAGKSTLLSAVVSANLNSPLTFLPEGTNMVTRMPICVQMQAPPDVFHHTAKIFNDERDGAETGVPGKQNEVECEGGADPSPEQLAIWGREIQQRITALQNVIEPTGRNVSNTKIIVRLTGPQMVNLSLVDLPGLTQVDGVDAPGLTKQIENLVANNITSSNCVILAVGEAGTDPKTWVGPGIANDIDVHSQRTVGVVTKTDLMFLADNKASLDNRQQIKEVIDGAERDIEWYAAYNPPDGDLEHLPHDWSDQIADTFGHEYSGNTNIANGLSKKLLVHLQEQLPRLHTQFQKRCAELRKELKMSFQANWTMVQKLVLTCSLRKTSNGQSVIVLQCKTKSYVRGRYGRFVQDYAQAERPEDVNGIGYMDFWGDHRGLFPQELINVLKEYSDKNTPIRIYNARGAKASILHSATQKVLKDADSFRVDLNRTRRDGRATQKTDEEVVISLASTLHSGLHSLTKEASTCMDDVQVLCTEFYSAVSKVEFGVDFDEGEKWTGSISQYTNLWALIQKGTQRVLQQNADLVKKKVLQDAEVVKNLQDVDEYFMPFNEVKSALERVCAFHFTHGENWVLGTPPSEPEPEPVPEVSSQLVRAPSAAERRMPDRPPNLDCYKQSVHMGRWPKRHIRMCTPDYPRGLMVHPARDVATPSQNSIFDLTGCTIYDDAKEVFRFGNDLFKLVIYKAGMEPNEQVNFGFDSDTQRREVATICKNLAAGREWNESAADKARKEAEERRREEEERRREKEAAEAAMQKEIQEKAEEAAQVEGLSGHVAPEPPQEGGWVPASEGEIRALRGDFKGDHQKRTRGELLDVCSPKFREFFKDVRSRPDGQQLQELKARASNEIRAEGFRLWSLYYVLANLKNVIDTTESELSSRFLDTRGKQAPFSAVSIFESIQLPELIEKQIKHPERHRQNDAASLLSIQDGVRDRAQKERCLHKLEDILQRFEEHDF